MVACAVRAKNDGREVPLPVSVRDRFSWGYALGLDRADTGFDFIVLFQFRTRVAEYGLEEKVLDLLPARLVEQGSGVGDGFD